MMRGARGRLTKSLFEHSKQPEFSPDLVLIDLFFFIQKEKVFFDVLRKRILKNNNVIVANK